MSGGEFIVGWKFIITEEKIVIFPMSLTGATIQDGG